MRLRHTREIRAAGTSPSLTRRLAASLCFMRSQYFDMYHLYASPFPNAVDVQCGFALA
jgi:hypothetical protein